MFAIFGKDQQLTMLMCSNLQECLDHRMARQLESKPLPSMAGQSRAMKHYESDEGENTFRSTGGKKSSFNSFI
ncbi:hypothetical protein GUITHDRAFT_121061 [Guillardia theta CCMP2712]|uniref:Uncharacterized protein n=1 Tax=Guillardia theta (strain CCMP2712) TaxID=905079 RepID=L1I916_GUITC|nr:hypothetical protein GUITHDRAFT_121061 [Guillardia theta CCMP2712]EKX32756.1 hypothetical protein GUITHDRAFT_121061 [Guillardia theta CCMP2712]|eukprot:XP_005819736.1 hypothetical protein GUITHDRAFT_121061 [Guillardia theta CCMP2712]